MYGLLVSLFQVTMAQGEAKILSQYNELVTEAKTQFQKELDNITPEIQSGWKGLSKYGQAALHVLSDPGIFRRPRQNCSVEVLMALKNHLVDILFFF